MQPMAADLRPLARLATCDGTHCRRSSITARLLGGWHHVQPPIDRSVVDFEASLDHQRGVAGQQLLEEHRLENRATDIVQQRRHTWAAA